MPVTTNPIVTGVFEDAVQTFISGIGITWAGHSSAITAGNGALQWFLLGNNNVLMRSDGTYWRPMNGRALLYQRSRTLTNPIATITGTAAAQNFTLPDTLLIPAGLMIPESRIYVTARMRRTTAGGGGTFAAFIRYGTANNPTDVSIDGGSMAPATNADFDAYTYLGFRAANSQNRSNFSPLNNSTAAMFSTDISFDAGASATYVNFGSDALMAVTEQMSLISYSVAVEF